MKSAFTLLLSILIFAACNKDTATTSELEITSGKGLGSETYPLSSVSDPDISGTVTFQKLGNGQTKVTIILDGTEDGDIHPAHIHFNSVAQGGGIAVSLTPVNGGSGRSTTIVNQMNNGTPVTYDNLINFDGHVNVHLSMSQLAILIAQGDVGSNF